MNRVVVSPSGSGLKPGSRAVSTGCEPWLYQDDERVRAKSTRGTNFFLGRASVVDRLVGDRTRTPRLGQSCSGHRIHPALAAPRLRRISASRLQSPPPCAAMYRKMKQNRTQGTPWFWIGEPPFGA